MSADTPQDNTGTVPLRAIVVIDYPASPPDYDTDVPAAMAKIDQDSVAENGADVLFNLMDTGETYSIFTPKIGDDVFTPLWWHKCGAWNQGSAHTSAACSGCGATTYEPEDVEEYRALQVAADVPQVHVEDSPDD